MAGRNFEDISSACEVAAQALQAIGNLRNPDIRNLAESTASNSSASNSNMSTTSGGNISAFAAELAQRFPTFNACINNTRGRESHSSGRSSVKKNSKKRKSNNNTQDASGGSGTKIGRPSKSVIHKVLVIIPNPDNKQVPSHSNRVNMQRSSRALLCFENHVQIRLIKTVTLQKPKTS